MRRLALILLPCAVAVLVHLWLAQRPSTTPSDNNTHSGTFFLFLSFSHNDGLYLHNFFLFAPGRPANFASAARVCSACEFFFVCGNR